jgi:hypothetical protein
MLGPHPWWQNAATARFHRFPRFQGERDFWRNI